MQAHTVLLPHAHDTAIDLVTYHLAEEGFGVITRIDMHKTFAEKLGVDFPAYTILGACNPGLAHKAVSETPEVGLMLPCNITVEALPEGTRVRIPDAESMLGGADLGGSPAMAELAKDAGARLARLAAALNE